MKKIDNSKEKADLLAKLWKKEDKNEKKTNTKKNNK